MLRYVSDLDDHSDRTFNLSRGADIPSPFIFGDVARVSCPVPGPLYGESDSTVFDRYLLINDERSQKA
jgi:hypothetical protein